MKITVLKKNPNNPRVIKDEQFKKLVESIKTFPEMMALRPVIIDENNIVLGGNMRLAALKELGYKEIPDEWVKKASELTEEQKKEFVIKDNLSFGLWDFDVLLQYADKDQLSQWGVEEDLLFDPDEFKRPQFGEEAIPEGLNPKKSAKNEKYFYVEYYDDEEMFLLVKEKLADIMDGNNRINNRKFADLIL